MGSDSCFIPGPYQCRTELGVTTKELALVIGGVVADATAWATLGARVAIGAACAAAAVLVVHRNHWSWWWAAALAVPVMALGGIGGWWTQLAFATPSGSHPRKDCTSVDMAETDPDLRTKQHLTCAKGVLTRAVWDLDAPDGIWVQPLTAHPPASSDLIIDDSGVRVGPGAKLVTTTDDRLSYSDCTDQEMNPERGLSILMPFGQGFPAAYRSDPGSAGRRSLVHYPARLSDLRAWFPDDAA
jgi:hypothetical protein